MSIRSFIAFQLPEDAKEFCMSIRQQLRSEITNAKWIKTENLHVTINFLGNRSFQELQTIAQNIDSINFPMNNIHFKASHLTFLGSGRVLSLVLIDKNRAAAEMVNKILLSNELRNDYPEWIPHIALARFKKRQDKRLLKSFLFDKSFGKFQFSPSDLGVFSSTPAPSGSIYKKISITNNS